jgi:putative membrane protein
LTERRGAQVAITHEAGAADLPDATELAMERTHLAHERTLMAWVRTATSLISFGFTIYKLFQYMREQQPGEPVRRLLGPREFALLMIGMGIVSLLPATLEHWQFRRRLRERHIKVPYSLAMAIAGLMSLLGILAFIAVIYRQ